MAGSGSMVARFDRWEAWAKDDARLDRARHLAFETGQPDTRPLFKTLPALSSKRSQKTANDTVLQTDFTTVVSSCSPALASVHEV